MKQPKLVIWYSNSYPKNFYDLAVCSIGNFDGVHLGHIKLLEEAQKEATKNNKKFYVITFVNNPKAFLKNIPEKNIDTFEEKIKKIIRAVNPDKIIAINFDDKFKIFSPHEFCLHLKEYFNIDTVVVGEDFRFGHKASGTVIDLKKEFYTIIVKHLNNHGTKLSTSNIKLLISHGKIKKANKQLSKQYNISGIVIKGAQLARELGYPTVNIDIPKDKILPKPGIYAGICTYNNEEYKAAINLGFCPTTGSGNNLKLEAHLLNFNEDVYGKKVCFTFSKFVRPEKKFKNVNDLKQAIANDVKWVNDYIKF